MFQKLLTVYHRWWYPACDILRTVYQFFTLDADRNTERKRCFFVSQLSELIMRFIIFGPAPRRGDLLRGGVIARIGVR